MIWKQTKNSEPEEYELLKTQEICSLIAVPIYANHQMNGFIGVDNPDLRQNEISITLLSDVGRTSWMCEGKSEKYGTVEKGS